MGQTDTIGLDGHPWSRPHLPGRFLNGTAFDPGTRGGRRSERGGLEKGVATTPPGAEGASAGSSGLSGGRIGGFLFRRRCTLEGGKMVFRPFGPARAWLKRLGAKARIGGEGLGVRVMGDNGRHGEGGDWSSGWARAPTRFRGPPGGERGSALGGTGGPPAGTLAENFRAGR